MEAEDFKKLLRRTIINDELMMLYGQDMSGHLPPLPQKERPKTSTVEAWKCGNQAMRQLSNVSRRGPRVMRLRQSAPPERLSPTLGKQPRPHTSYSDYIRDVLNRRYSQLDKRPHTTDGQIERLPFKKTPEELMRIYSPVKVDENEEAEKNEGVGDLFSTMTMLSMKKPLTRGLRGRGRTRDSRRAKRRGSAGARQNKECMKIMSGDYTILFPDVPTSVALYLSAPVNDFREERKLLNKHILPELQEYCTRNRLDLEVVDLHMGATEGSAVHAEWGDFIRRGVQHCSSTSLGPCFVLLLGDKYDPSDVPVTMTPEELSTLKVMGEEEQIQDMWLLDSWYKLESNRATPLYVLQTESTTILDNRGRKKKLTKTDTVDPRLIDPTVFEQIRPVLHSIIAAAATAAIKEGKMQKDVFRRFFRSVIDTEVQEGLLQHPAATEHCLSYIRQISDIQNYVTTEHGQRFLDILLPSGGSPGVTREQDGQAKQMLLNLKAEVYNKLTGVAKQYTIALGEYLQGYTEEGGGYDQLPYLQQLVSDVPMDVKAMVEKMKEDLECYTTVKHYHVYKEVHLHARQAKTLSTKFQGQSGHMAAIESYMKDSSRRTRPLIIHGVSGCGKSSLLSMIAHKCNYRTWLDQSAVLVIRFIGTTTHSSGLKDLLLNICEQLCVVYNMDPVPSEVTYSAVRMTRHFLYVLEQVSKWHGDKKPLVLLLDGLEALDHADRAHTLFWLPSVCPEHVCIVITVESDSTELVERLQMKLDCPDNFLDVSKFDSEAVVPIIDKILADHNMSLTDDQKAALVDSCMLSPNPLLVEFATKNATKWKSYTEIEPEQLEPTLHSAVSHYLEEQERCLGAQVIYHFICYLLASHRRGISRAELNNVLSCNDEFLRAVFLRDGFVRDDFVRVTSVQFYQLLDVFSPMLTEHESHGKKVLGFSNSAYRRICHETYITNTDTPETSEAYQSCWRDLAAVLQCDSKIYKTFITPKTYEELADADRGVTPQPLTVDNKRRLHLQPLYLTLASGAQEISDALKQHCLCNFKWILVKLQATTFSDVIQDYYRIKIRDSEVDMIREFLKIAQQAVEYDPTHLPAQVLGCIPDINQHDYPMVSQFVSDARGWIDEQTDTQLLPAIRCFPSPLATCKARYWNIVDVLQLTDRFAVVRSKDSAIEVWDFYSKELLYSTLVKYDKTNQNVFCTTSAILTYYNSMLSAWDIPAGDVTKQLDVSCYVDDSFTSCYILTVNATLRYCVMYGSDDEFNQVLHILDIEKDKQIAKLDGYGLKDDFYKNSAFFTSNDQQLVFINAKSETAANDKSVDYVYLNIFDMSKKTLTDNFKCGSKKFSRLLHPDDFLAVIAYGDGSFDIYDISNVCLFATIDSPLQQVKPVDWLFIDSRRLVCMYNTGDDELQTPADKLSSAWVWQWTIPKKAIKDAANHTLSGALVIEQQNHAKQKPASQMKYVEDHDLMLTLTTEGSMLKIWEYDVGNCLCSVKTHLHVTDKIYQTADPFVIYTTSVSECVSKRWDLCHLIMTSKMGGSTLPAGAEVSAAGEEVTSEPGGGGGVSGGSVGGVTPSRYPPPPSAGQTPHALSRRRSSIRSSKSIKSVRFADDVVAPQDDNASLPSIQTMISAPDATPTPAPTTPLTPTPSHASSTQLSDLPLPDANSEEGLMFGVTSVVFTQDSKFFFTGYNDRMGALWSSSTVELVLKLQPHTPQEIATPWLAVACADAFVVGLSATKDSWNQYPYFYRYRVWDRHTGRPLNQTTDIPAISCGLSNDRARIAIVSVSDLDPEGVVKQNLTFKLVNIRDEKVLQSVCYHTYTIPTIIHLTEDDKYAVTNNVPRLNEDGAAPMVFRLDFNVDEDDDPDNNPMEEYGEEGDLKPKCYEFRHGTKFEFYKVSFNVILKNGLSVAVGQNGDLQMWDVQTCEYEGNLYFDPDVRDTRDASLHNHNGKPILNAAVSDDGRYLVCGGGDNKASLWDLENEVLLQSYGGHTDEVTQVAISHDNKLVVTASRDNTLCVWQLMASDKPLSHIYIHVMPTSVTIAKDKSAVVVCGARKNEPVKMLVFELRSKPATGKSAR